MVCNEHNQALYVFLYLSHFLNVPEKSLVVGRRSECLFIYFLIHYILISPSAIHSPETVPHNSIDLNPASTVW